MNFPTATQNEVEPVVVRVSQPARVVRITARLNVGGIARHVTWLTVGLSPARFDTVLVTGTVPAGEDDMRSFAIGQGATPQILPEMSREISPKDLLTVWKLYRMFVRMRPDVIHTHSAKAGAVGRMAGMLYRWLTPTALFGRPRRCRMVHTFHGHIFHSYYGRLKTWLFLMVEKLLARAATDRIVVISSQQFHEIHAHFGVGQPEQFRIVPLGLDLQMFSAWSSRRHIVRDELGVADNDVLIGIVGRLTEIKDHSLFLRVAAHYLQSASAGKRRVRFLIIGNGHLRKGLEAQARGLGLADAVTFLGMRDDPENFYPALDVVALTSRNEGTPLTLIEGMANGRAVIATNVGGVIDLLGRPERPDWEEGCALCQRGVLVRPGDAAAFSRGLSRLIEDADLRRDLGIRGQDFIERCYSKERLISDIGRLYDDLLTTSTRIDSQLSATEPCLSPSEAGKSCAS